MQDIRKLREGDEPIPSANYGTFLSKWVCPQGGVWIWPFCDSGGGIKVRLTRRVIKPEDNADIGFQE